MRYTDEDIEFANLILTDRENLDDAKVEAWMKDPEHVMLLKEFATVYQKRMNIDFNRDKKEEFARLENTIQERKSRRMTLRWSVAASVILLIGLFVGRMVNEWRDLDEMRMLAETERIVPGVKAELILSTGERVVLNQQRVSIEGVNETGIQNDSVTGLNYTMAKVQGEELVYNTMRIPVGGFYQLALSDGSKVWLNSMTELRFPVAFTGEERKVYLTGEAYFEVAADPDRLFVVEGGGVVVKVHGTVFNMKAREKQDHVDVSLLSGLVVVENHGVSRSLNPGETAVCKKSVPSIEKKTTDVSISCLWAKESLRFEKKTIYELAGYLSEWYGMDIRLDPSLPTDQAYTFTITHESLEEVLCLIAKITPIEYVFDEDNTVRITRK